jgi:hypothetical protein
MGLCFIVFITIFIAIYVVIAISVVLGIPFTENSFDVAAPIVGWTIVGFVLSWVLRGALLRIVRATISLPPK